MEDPQTLRNEGCDVGCSFAQRVCQDNQAGDCVRLRLECAQSCRGQSPHFPIVPARTPCPPADERVHGCLRGCERNTNLTVEQIMQCQGACVGTSPTSAFPRGLDGHYRRHFCPQGLAQLKGNSRQNLLRLKNKTGAQRAFSAQQFVKGDYFKVFVR
jgi:hypothetical protein